MTAQPIVFIVDDDPALRKSLVAAVESASLGASSFATAQDFLDDYDPATPGCLILDLRMPGMNGLQLLEHLRAQGMHLPVIVFSGSADVASAVQSMKLGAVDFLEKPADYRLLVARVREAIWLDEQRRQDRQEIDVFRTRLEALTTRERQLLDLITAGHSSKQIARQLGLSVRTVENHRNHLMSKMQAANAADLVRMRMTLDARPAAK
jgi:two-component system response regulator FixJ